MPRPSDHDRAHHVPLMNGIGSRRGVPPSDVAAIVAAYECGTITADAGHKLIATQYAGKKLPAAVAAFKPAAKPVASAGFPTGTPEEAEAAHVIGLHRKEIPLATLTPKQVEAQGQRNAWGETPEQAEASEALARRIVADYRGTRPPEPDPTVDRILKNYRGSR